jgi:hypothetical protein
VETSDRANEHLGSTKCGEFLDYQSDCYFLKEDCASWIWIVWTNSAEVSCAACFIVLLEQSH